MLHVQASRPVRSVPDLSLVFGTMLTVGKAHLRPRLTESGEIGDQWNTFHADLDLDFLIEDDLESVNVLPEFAFSEVEATWQDEVCKRPDDVPQALKFRIFSLRGLRHQACRDPCDWLLGADFIEWFALFRTIWEDRVDSAYPLHFHVVRPTPLQGTSDDVAGHTIVTQCTPDFKVAIHLSVTGPLVDPRFIAVQRSTAMLPLFSGIWGHFVSDLPLPTIVW